MLGLAVVDEVLAFATSILLFSSMTSVLRAVRNLSACISVGVVKKRSFSLKHLRRKGLAGFRADHARS